MWEGSEVNEEEIMLAATMRSSRSHYQSQRLDDKAVLASDKNMVATVLIPNLFRENSP